MPTIFRFLVFPVREVITTEYFENDFSFNTRF